MLKRITRDSFIELGKHQAGSSTSDSPVHGVGGSGTEVGLGEGFAGALGELGGVLEGYRDPVLVADLTHAGAVVVFVAGAEGGELAVAAGVAFVAGSLVFVGGAVADFGDAFFFAGLDAGFFLTREGMYVSRAVYCFVD